MTKGFRSLGHLLWRLKTLQWYHSWTVRNDTTISGFLSPLDIPLFYYFQMSGRAGRRGFDPVGNVVFFGVPYRKVQRLITANIPKLVGNFPINVSLVLRLLLMTSKGDDKKDALTKVCEKDLENFLICQLF